MKKIVIISIIIAAAVAIFAVVAGKNDAFNPVEAENPAVEKKIESENLKKDIKVPVRAIKMQKIKLIDKEKFKENLKKMKEKQGKNPDNAPDFQKKGESCGE
ncbi:hypothetical protein II898_06510 [bacterium]|nr:hypothetical protein [bacterium]